MKTSISDTEKYEQLIPSVIGNITAASLLSLLITSLLTSLFLIALPFTPAHLPASGSTKIAAFALQDHCAHISPIKVSEYHRRQRTLASILEKHNVSAYIAEPGASATFFGNISQESWRLSERPLLLIVTPPSTGEKSEANVLVLTPKFEAARAKALAIPARVQFIEWPEEVNPYELVAKALPSTTETIFLDKSIRKFIFDGLHQALSGARILSAPDDISQLRERKSKAELELLRCANEATILAVRAVHKQLFIGVRESEARSMMAQALSAVGLKNGGCLTLFGENAALPHGSGTDRTLGPTDFALFDCTATLHGYFSDVTRTVALLDAKIPEENLNIWNHVHSAQTLALHTARAGIVTGEVDKAARLYLKAHGYAQYFTHRLGHGIGLEGHEQPYLRGGNDAVIQRGNTFSDEPGIYIGGQIGVRLEDCFYINDEGSPVLLTERVGGQSKSPWAP